MVIELGSGRSLSLTISSTDTSSLAAMACNVSPCCTRYNCDVGTGVTVGIGTGVAVGTGVGGYRRTESAR